MRRRDFLKVMAAGAVAATGLLPKIQMTKELAPISFVEPIKGATVRTVHTTYALGWEVSKDLLPDAETDIFAQMSSDLADAALRNRDRLAWSLIDNLGVTA